jgi:GT2 family glycosyltransferase
VPEATVVIATRDRASLLRDCLGGLARQSAAGRFEVIVVDNGSSDETPRVIREAGALNLFVADPNRAKARNAGIAQAAGRIVIFCDDDTLPPVDFVQAHLRAHGDALDRAVTGPIVNVPDAQHLPPADSRHYSRQFFCTCNASAPKAALQAVGGFDERYDLYGWEDTDLGVRLRANGMRHVFAWDAYIYHLKPDSMTTLERRIALTREKAAMAARFVRKNPSWRVRLATGAYAANFVRASIVNARPLRRMYERLSEGSPTLLRRLAREALIDAHYVDALRTALRRPDA